MAKLSVKAGSTSQAFIISILNSAASPAVPTGLANLVYNSSGLTAYYARTKSAAVAITLATQTATGAFSSGGFVAIDNTNMPGVYRLDLPDAALASAAGVNNVVVMLKGAGNMVQCLMEIELTGWDNQLVPGAAGGMLIAGSNAGTTTFGALTVTGASTLTGNVVLSDGITVSAPSTANRAGVTITGNGSGAGVLVTGGATGDGVKYVGGASGHGLTATGTGTTKHGINAVGGATTSAGIAATGGSTSGDGILVAATSGHGINTTGAGTTKHGIAATGGATSSAGISAVGGGSGNGITATGGATGHGIGATGGSSSGDGLNAVAATSGAGITATGVGTTKPGIVATGGATTSAGISAIGGSTSGDGILTAATSGHGIVAAGTGTTKHGIHATGGSTTSHGINALGGGVGHGILATSGSGSTGDGIRASAASTNGNGLNALGVGTGAGTLTTGGATGIGLSVVGGGTSGDGIKVVTTSGHGVNLAPVGSSMHGVLATGGNGGTSDGLKAVAGTGGVPIRGDITGNLTGNVSGSVGSVTGLTASNLDATVSSRMATYTQPTGFLAATFPSGTVANTTNITAATGIDVTKLLGTAWLTPATAGTPDVNAKLIGGQTASASGTITFPNATLASTTNITAGTIAITSNVKKNQALSSFEFLMTDSTNHAPVTGKTVTVTRSIDGGSFAAGSLSAVTEVANGIYKVDFAAADLNGNVVTLRATATNADDTLERIVTQP